MQIKEKIAVIDSAGKYETLIVGGGGELEMIDTIASEVLECPVRVYRPQTIGARDMSLVGTIGMIYYLMERNKIVGNYTPSLVLPDIWKKQRIRHHPHKPDCPHEIHRRA